MRIRANISYSGSLFFGSQIQPDKNTVANSITKVLNRLNIHTKIDFSGRTDKGVHATYQVISFDIDDYWEDRLKYLQDILNKHLKGSIKVNKLEKTSLTFHARYSAKKRVYRYLVTTNPTTPFNNDFLTYIPNVNEELISSAIKELIGTHDFEYFSKNNPQNKTTIRTMYNTMFYKYKNVYVFKFEANGFLRSQIRAMVGFLIAISDGKLSIEDLKNQLNKKELVYYKPAPSNGLYLTKVKY